MEPNYPGYKPKKKIEKNSRGMEVFINIGYGLKQIAKMTLGSGNLEMAVELPEGEDLNEWFAVNTIEFYNDINLLYGMLVEFCTGESCPVMSAGPKYEYLWADGTNVKTPLKVSAAEYIEYLMTWVENQLNNETIFPSQVGKYYFIKITPNFYSFTIYLLKFSHLYQYRYLLPKEFCTNYKSNLQTSFQSLCSYILYTLPTYSNARMPIPPQHMF
jgi:MOB kinase activator 1